MLGSLPEGKAHELLQLGFFLPTDQYWKDGMADWVPLASLPPEVPAESWLSTQSRILIETQWPSIQTAAMKQAGEISSEVLRNDDLMVPIISTIYKAMPLAFTIAVKEKTFIDFCLSQRTRLMAP